MTMSPSNWELRLDGPVPKALKRFPTQEAQRLLKIMKLMPADPYFGDIKKMKGEVNVWRRRVGSYRIFYKVDAERKVVLVFHVERRTSATY